MSPAPIAAVTGINGFIAAHAVLRFLAHGWHVRGSVRSAAKADKVKQLPSYKEYVEQGKLEVVVVEDLVEGDFGELLEGVTGVAHIAAPLGLTEAGWEGYKGPTITGMRRLLEASKAVPTIKGVALMSSMSAAYDILTPNDKQVGKVYTEDDWTPLTEQMCLDVDPKSPQAMWYYYGAAKRLAEQGALEFEQKEKPSFSIATICPPMVFGAFKHIATPEELNSDEGSVPRFAALLTGKDKPIPSTGAMSYVDGHDVGEAFYLAVEKQVSGRFLLAAGKSNTQTVLNTLRQLRPDLDEYIIKGEPDKTDIGPTSYIDSSKSKKELGLEYRSLEDTLKDSLDYLDQIGLFKIPPGAWKK
ncbi:hypothetical protein IAT38_004380 [Cryptococcus sp. DSM 104549]